jgi:hypothetical protein
MKFNRELAIKVALVVAILIVMSVSAHLYSKRKKEHFEEIDVDALSGFSKGDPGSNWDDQDLWNKGDHKVPTIAGGSDSQFKNNIVNMILAKAATASSSGRGSVKTGFNTKIATVESEMDAISNQVATNKSAQVVINAKRQTYRDNEPTRISDQIATDNQEDNKKIATAFANQASEQKTIDNKQDITITSMVAKNNTQDEHITYLDLPVRTIITYAPKTTLGLVDTEGSIRYNLFQKGWAICDSDSSKDVTVYNEEIIPDLTERFLKGENFTTTAPSIKTGGKSQIRLTVQQMPPHNHSYTASQTLSHSKAIDNSNSRNTGSPESRGYTSTVGGDGGVAAPIDLRPPFYMVVYIMKFKSVS